MRKNLALLLSLFVFAGVFAQGKYSNYLNSKKIAASIKTVKEREKDDYFQQYYWVSKMEELKAVPHLKSIKPVVLYNFVKKINPANPSKQLNEEEKKLRYDANKSLTQYFTKKDYQNPLIPYNIESYVDPSGELYYTGVNAEKIQELVPKRLFYFTTFNKKTREEKKYYLWVNDDEFKIVDIAPNEKNTEFFTETHMYVPGYQISQLVPTVKMGDQRLKNDKDFFYITPFQETDDNIVYKTQDFKDFEVVRYKHEGGPWTEIEKRKRR